MKRVTVTAVVVATVMLVWARTAPAQVREAEVTGGRLTGVEAHGI